ncbi:MAG: acyltransferase [Pseudomonadota bacterium]
MADSNSAPTWQRRPEAGSRFGMQVLLWITRLFGRRVVHAVMAPVSAYFLFTRGPERRASRAFLDRALDRRASLRDVYRHFFRFACMSVDRAFFLLDAKRSAAGLAEQVPVTFVGGPESQAVVDAGRPGIFLAAHLGSFEASRVLGAAFGGMDLRIVLDRNQGARISELAAELNPELAKNVIDAGSSTVELGLKIKEALAEGAWVGFLADRYRDGDRTLPVPFLGQTALFPVGPYLIANTFKAPVIGTFCRQGAAGYEVHCEVLSEAVDLPRGQREAALAALVERYVSRLEHHVRASPYAWFNFFDFWAGASGHRRDR